MRHVAFQQGVGEAYALLGVKTASSLRDVAGLSAALLGTGAVLGAGTSLVSGEDALPGAYAGMQVPAVGLGGAVAGGALGALPGHLLRNPLARNIGGIVGSTAGGLLGTYAGGRRADEVRDASGTPEQRAARQAVLGAVEKAWDDGVSPEYLDARAAFEQAHGRRNPLRHGAGGAILGGALGSALGSYGGTPGMAIGGALGAGLVGYSAYQNAQEDHEGIDLHRAAQAPGASADQVAARDAWLQRLNAEMGHGR